MCSELDSHQAADLGLSAAEAAAIAQAYQSNFAYVYAELTRRGAYTEQQFTTVSPPGSSQQCRGLLGGALGCSSGGAAGAGPPPSLLVRMADSNPRLSFATYLLGRGAYGWFGHTWQGCGSPDVNQPTVYPLWHSELYDADYGEPLEVCRETAAGSGVFERRWSKAYVSLDCSNLSVNLTLY